MPFSMHTIVQSYMPANSCTCILLSTRWCCAWTRSPDSKTWIARSRSLPRGPGVLEPQTYDHKWNGDELPVRRSEYRHGQGDRQVLPEASHGGVQETPGPSRLTSQRWVSAPPAEPPRIRTGAALPRSCRPCRMDPLSQPTATKNRRFRQIKGPSRTDSSAVTRSPRSRLRGVARNQEVRRGLARESGHLLKSGSGISSGNEILEFYISLIISINYVEQVEALVGIEPTNKGFADLLSNRYILLISNGLEVVQRRLRTILGPNCRQGSSTGGSPAAIRCARFVRRSSPIH